MRLLTLLLCSLLTMAAQAATLTDSEIKLWIKTMPTLQGWLDEREDQLPDNDIPDADYSMDAAFARGIDQLREAGLYNQFSQQVKNAGFKSVEDWVRVSQQISMAYIAISMEEQPATRVEIENQMQAIRSAKNIPAEEKAMLENMLQASLNMLDSLANVTAADKDRVRPYLPQLVDQFGDNEE